MAPATSARSSRAMRSAVACMHGPGRAARQPGIGDAAPEQGEAPAGAVGRGVLQRLLGAGPAGEEDRDEAQVGGEHRPQLPPTPRAAFAAACRSARNQPPTPRAIERDADHARPAAAARGRRSTTARRAARRRTARSGACRRPGPRACAPSSARSAASAGRRASAIAVRARARGRRRPRRSVEPAPASAAAPAAARPADRASDTRRPARAGRGHQPRAASQRPAPATMPSRTERDHHGSTARMRSPGRIPARRTSAQKATNHIPQTTASTACPTGVPKGAR